MTVYIDEEGCIGCAPCEEICPEVFKLNIDTEKAEVVMPEDCSKDFIEDVMCNYSSLYIYEEY